MGSHIPESKIRSAEHSSSPALRNHAPGLACCGAGEREQVRGHRKGTEQDTADGQGAGVAVTVANLAGYVGEHVEQYQNGRQTLATGRSMALERLARLKDERKAIAETRPSAAIAAALNDTRRSERPALLEALATAKRRDALDIELATFEQWLGEIPQVATTDASASVLSDIVAWHCQSASCAGCGWRLLPLTGGLVLSLAIALTALRHELTFCTLRPARRRAPALRARPLPAVVRSK